MRTFLFILITTLAFAQTIELEGVHVQPNLKYSWKDFTNKTLLDAKDVYDIVIARSCFYQEVIVNHEDQYDLVDVFPEDAIIVFVDCNLDNVRVPVGSTIVGRSSNRRIATMPIEAAEKSELTPKDHPIGERKDWILDTGNKPVEPTNKEQLIEEGKNVDPKNIPRESTPVLDPRR